ncbi:MAG: DNA (cytosine-5-)-methyltransferase [Bacteroidia bacterium]|nr:DNA (cytosine-5-)-methyltransferase [Bacteroidia bacterium]
MEKTNKYKVLSLFSGRMGLDLGLELTGRFETVICIEKEKAFCETIRLNHSKGRLSENLKIVEADISKLNPIQILSDLNVDPKSIDIIVGGPPCQSFSTAGRRGTIQDPRGTLLWDFLRFIQHVKPKMFLMENVRGLLSAALNHRPIAQRPERGGEHLNEEEMPGSVVKLFAQDLASLDDIGYNLDIFEVNSVNYGAPQIRERVLFVGNCYGKKVEFPKPTHGNHTSKKGAHEQQALFGKKENDVLPWKTLGNAIGDLEENDPTVLDFSPRKKSFLAMVPPGSNWRSLPEDIQKESMGRAWHAKGGRSGWWRRLTFDLPSPTLVTMPNHASTSLCHPTKTRALSIKEYARIQEFPDDWEFSGTVSQQYAQVGNAVPTRLGKVLGNVIAKELDYIISSGAAVHNKATADPRIVYIQSHIRTRQWFKNGKVHVWSDGANNDHASYSLPKTTKKINTI